MQGPRVSRISARKRRNALKKKGMTSREEVARGACRRTGYARVIGGSWGTGETTRDKRRGVVTGATERATGKNQKSGVACDRGEKGGESYAEGWG